MEVAQVKEDIQLKLVDLQAQKMLNGGKITTAELEATIIVAGGEAIKDASGEITEVKVGDTTIPIEEVTQGITIGDAVEYAPYDNPYIPIGFTHIGTADWNSGYQIQETATGNVFVWVPCVTDRSKVKVGDKVETFKKTLPTPKEDGTLDTLDPYYMYNKLNLTITGDESLANAIETSVGTHGGFYISAYEAGVPLAEDGTEIEPTSESATVDKKARSVADAKAWTNITRTNAITASANMIDAASGVKSGLISGKCWDTTLQWMAHSSTNAVNEPNLGYDTDSSGNGWYSDVSNKAKTITGKYPINNIYDMAGNVWEWTTENCTDNGSSCLVSRGGGYGFSGSGYPAAFRDDGGDSAYDYLGFRVVLYK